MNPYLMNHDCCPALGGVKKAPARGFQQLVDLDTGVGFFGHMVCCTHCERNVMD